MLQTREDFLREIEQRAAELKTPKDGLILYSGKNLEPRAPQVESFQYAAWITSGSSGELRTIDHTPLAKSLNTALSDPSCTLSKESKRQVDVELSRQVCRMASGNITVLLGKSVRPDGIFAQSELPTLLDPKEAKDITHVNGIDRNHLRAVWEADRTPDKHIAKDMIWQTLKERGPKIDISDRALEQRLGQLQRQELQKKPESRAPEPPPPPPPAPHHSRGY